MQSSGVDTATSPTGAKPPVERAQGSEGAGSEGGRGSAEDAAGRTAFRAIGLALAALPLGEVLAFGAEDPPLIEGGSWVRG